MIIVVTYYTWFLRKVNLYLTEQCYYAVSDITLHLPTICITMLSETFYECVFNLYTTNELIKAILVKSKDLDIIIPMLMDGSYPARQDILYNNHRKIILIINRVII